MSKPDKIKKALQKCKTGEMIVDYGYQMSYVEVSRELGLTPSQVKTIENQAIYKIKKALREVPQLKELLSDHLLTISGGQGEY